MTVNSSLGMFKKYIELQVLNIDSMFYGQIERLRKEGSRLLEEEQERMREELKSAAFEGRDQGFISKV